MHRSIFLLTLVLILGVASPLTLARGQPSATHAQIIEEWRNSLREADDAVRAGRWKKARRSVNSVLTEMCDRITNGEGVAGLFAYATFVRAIAESGLGNEGRASWDFQIAQTLQPQLAKANLRVYGEVGQRLGEWRIPEDEGDRGESSDRAEDADSQTEEADLVVDDVEPPKKKVAPLPKYPFGQRWARAEGPIVVQFVVDEEGIPRSPRLKTEQEPLLGFAAMDALRDWRFEPARKAGEPIDVYYNLQVNFKLLRD